MPAGLDPEWLARTMANCSSVDEPTRRAAWEEFARAIWPDMLRLAIREQHRSWAATASWMIAEDAAMHTFMKLMRKLEAIEPAKLFGWIRIVIRNEIISLRRIGFYAHETSYTVDDVWDATTNLSHRDTSRALSVVDVLRREVRKLRPEDRELIYARFWLELSFDEIGAELGGISRQAAISRLKTVCKKLHDALTHLGYDNDFGATTDRG